MFLGVFVFLFMRNCSTRPPLEVTSEQADTSRTYNSMAIQYFMSGEDYAMQGNHARAVLEYQDALLYDSTSATIYGAMAKAYINLGKLERGISALKKALTIDPKEYELREILAQVYYLKGQNQKAEAEYIRLIKANPDDPELHYQLAAIYLKNKKLNEAINEYESIYKKDNSETKALEKAAEISLITQQLNRAASYYDTLRKIYPNNPDYYRYRAEIALANSDIPLATALYDSLLNLQPEDIEIRERYGDLLARGDSAGKAVDYLKTLIKEYPARQSAYISLVMLYSRNDQIDSLLILTDKAMQSFPDQAYFPIMRANIFSNHQKYAEAAENLIKALEIDPENNQARILLANAWEAQKKHSLSDSLYEAIIADNPDEAIALNNYAYSLALRGERLIEAMTMVDKALSIDPKNPSYIDTKGWILYLRGNYKNARKYIEQALDLNENNVEVLEHMGDVLQKLNKTKEAQKYYRQALEINPDNESLRQKISE